VEDDPAVTTHPDRAINETSATAEYAYFAALVQAAGDPTFTEASRTGAAYGQRFWTAGPAGTTLEAGILLDGPKAAVQPSDSR
jgi:hypothetical protein